MSDDIAAIEARLREPWRAELGGPLPDALLVIDAKNAEISRLRGDVEVLARYNCPKCDSIRLDRQNGEACDHRATIGAVVEMSPRPAVDQAVVASLEELMARGARLKVALAGNASALELFKVIEAALPKIQELRAEIRRLRAVMREVSGKCREREHEAAAMGYKDLAEIFEGFASDLDAAAGEKS